MMQLWKKRLWITGVLMLTGWILVLPLSAAETETVYTLEKSVTYGLEHNPGLQAARFGVDSADQEIKSVRGNLLPSLSSGYSHTRISSISAKGATETDYLDQNQDLVNVRLSQTLFAGLTLYNALQKAKAARDLAEAKQEITALDLIIKIQTGFLELLKARQDVIILQDAIARLDVVHQAVKAFNQQQLLPYSRVLEAEVDLADARQQMSQARNMVENKRIILNSLLDIPLETMIVYRGTLHNLAFDWPTPLEQCLDAALANRPDLKAVRHNLMIAEKEAAIAKGRYAPKVSVDAGYYHSERDYDSYGGDWTNEYWTFGLNLQWHMFDGGYNYYQKKKYDSEMMRLRSLEKDTENNIRTRVRTSFTGMEEARQRIDLTARAVEAAEENYRQEKKRFEVRVGTLPSLFDAQERLTRAHSNKNQALRDYQISLANLYYAMGERNPGLNRNDRAQTIGEQRAEKQ